MKIIWSLVMTGIGISLVGCAESQPRLSDDFGAAIRQDLVAQIADPDARYPRKPPASDGVRAALAQERYQTGTSIQPIGSASKIGALQATPQPQQQQNGGQGGSADTGASGP